MRKFLLEIGLLFLLCVIFFSETFSQENKSEYVVLVQKAVRTDVSWGKVVDELVRKHQAEVVMYDSLISETLLRLREIYPRYVAVVEKPENINREFVIDLNQMSRQVDGDIYVDFLWGIITGYDAESALRLIERGDGPKEMSSAWCLGALSELKDGRYFERMGLCCEERRGNSKNEWIEKNSLVSAENQLDVNSKIIYWGENNHPDIVIWEAVGQPDRMCFQWKKGANMDVVTCRGKLWRGERELKLQDNVRVCFLPMAYGNTWGTKESFPISWLKSEEVGALVSGMDFSTFGKGTWGTLQFWLTDAGRFSLAEAQFLNQQDLLCRLKQWKPELLEKNFVYSKKMDDCLLTYYQAEQDATVELLRGDANAFKKFYYMYERDIMVYYGDPAWRVTAKDVIRDLPYTVSCKMKGKKCVVTIRTTATFSWERLHEGIMQRVGELPVCYFFPKRLKNPRLAEKQEYELNVVVDENFLFVYDTYFKPNKKYKIVLDMDK